MVKITHQPPLPPTTISPSQRSHSVQPAAPLTKEREDTPPQEKPFVERRKKMDRRKSRLERGPYDMRNGRDRRKNTGKGSIETDV